MINLIYEDQWEGYAPDLQDIIDDLDFHILKTQQPYFNHVLSGDKTFEIRKNDRDFKKEDLVLLVEFNDKDNIYGRFILCRISYVIKGGKFGLNDEYCVFSLDELDLSNYDLDAIENQILILNGEMGIDT